MPETIFAGFGIFRLWYFFNCAVIRVMLFNMVDGVCRCRDSDEVIW